jgi:hypothetical protein
MKVKELIDILSGQDPESHVLIRFLNGDAFGSAWPDVEDFDEDDVIAEDHTVILDISNK